MTAVASVTPAHRPMTPEPLPIRQVRRETHDTWTLTLDGSSRPDGFRFAPGQFNMLYAFGIGEVPISMSGDPSKPEELVHTIRAVGAVTGPLCRLQRGDALGVRGPYGQPWPVSEVTGADVLLIAGGLGLAPLRPVVYHILRHRADYGAVALLVGGRAPEELLFRAELARWEKRADLQVLVTVDRAGADWRGLVGVVPAFVAAARFDPQRAVAFVCGPEVMMRFTVRELERQGLVDERIYFSMERNMQCAVGFCGHCQLGPTFVCKDGPVLRYDRIRPLFSLREV